MFFWRPKLWSIFNLRPEQYSGEMDLVNLTKTQQEHSVYNLIRVNSWIGKKKKKKNLLTIFIKLGYNAVNLLAKPVYIFMSKKLTYQQKLSIYHPKHLKCNLPKHQIFQSASDGNLYVRVMRIWSKKKDLVAVRNLNINRILFSFFFFS